MLEQVVKDTTAALYRAIDHPVQELQPQEIGKVTRVSGGIAHVKGLPGVALDELVEFPSGVLGIVIDLGPDEVGVMLMDDTDQITAGIDVARTFRTADTPVGEELLGRVLDATGRALDYGEELGALTRWPIERVAPAIIERAGIRSEHRHEHDGHRQLPHPASLRPGPQRDGDLERRPQQPVLLGPRPLRSAVHRRWNELGRSRQGQHQHRGNVVHRRARRDAHQ